MPSYIICTHTRCVLCVAYHASQMVNALCWRKFCYFRVSPSERASGMDFGDVDAARVATGRQPDVTDVWKAAAADALAAEPPPPKTGWDSVVHKRVKHRSKHTEQLHRFGSFRTYFRRHGSAIFHRAVVGRSLVASIVAETAYYANRCAACSAAQCSTSLPLAAHHPAPPPPLCCAVSHPIAASTTSPPSTSP